MDLFSDIMSFLPKIFSNSEHEQSILSKLKAQIEQNPRDITKLLNYATTLSSFSRYEAAELVFRKVLQLEKSNVVYRQHGKILMKLNRFIQAKYALEEGIKLNNTDSQSFLELAKVLSHFGLNEKAEQNFKMAIMLKKGQAHYHSEYGLFLGHLGRRKEAKEQFEKAINLNPNESEFYFNQGENFHMMQRVGEAKQMFEKAIEIEDDEPLYYSAYGNLFAKQHNYKQAQRLFQKGLEVKEDSVLALNNYSLFLMKMGRNEEAKRLLERALTINEDDGQIYSNYGYVLFKTGEFEKARSVYEKGIRKSPEDGSIYSNYAILLNQMNLKDQANTCYLKAIQYQPQNQKYHFNYASFLMKFKRFQEAENQFKRAISLNPKNPYSHYNYSCLLNQLEKIPQAIIEIRSCLELDGTNPLFLFLASVYHCKGNQHVKAEKYFQKAKTIINSDEMQSGELLKVSLEKFSLSLQMFKQIKWSLTAYQHFEKRFRHLQQSQTLGAHENKEMMEIKCEAMNSFQQIILQAKEEGKREERLVLESKIEFLLKKLQQMQGRVHHLEDEITSIKKQLSWDEEFSQMLSHYKANKQDKTVLYAKNMCWMLCTSISSFRELKIGIVKKGEISQKSKLGSYVSKVSKVLSKAQFVPIIGKYCRLLSGITAIFVDMEEDQIIEKIVSATTDLHSQKLLSKAVTRTVLQLIKSKKHLILLQKQDKKEENFFTKLQAKKKKILSQMMKMQLAANQKQAIIDCSIMIGQMVKFPCKQENVIETAGLKMLVQKVGEENVEENQKIDVSTEAIIPEKRKEVTKVQDEKYCSKCLIM